MLEIMLRRIILFSLVSGFSAFANDHNGRIPNSSVSISDNNSQFYGFDNHSLVFGATTACFLFSSSYEQSHCFPEICMNGLRAGSLGIMTSYILNFGGSIIRTCYDYGLETFDKKIFDSIDKKIEKRIEQLDQTLEDRTEQLDNALNERIQQVNDSSIGGFLHAIVKGNSQGNQE
ncbi:MAG: hypothetical protein AB8G05_10585 [Oligoflexales bacterium]